MNGPHFAIVDEAERLSPELIEKFATITRTSYENAASSLTAAIDTVQVAVQPLIYWTKTLADAIEPLMSVEIEPTKRTYPGRSSTFTHRGARR